jgi:hypothetical protein
MGAEIALGRRVVVRIDIQSVVRTSLHASFATDATLVVEIDDSIGPPVECASRTNFRAWSVIAVIAPHHTEVARCMRKLPLFDVLDPRPKNANGDLVFFFARNRAGVAPDTTVLIYDKTVAHLWKITLMSRNAQRLQARHHS